MSWLCKIGNHKWEVTGRRNLYMDSFRWITTRKCVRCEKLQEGLFGVIGSPLFNPYEDKKLNVNEGKEKKR